MPGPYPRQGHGGTRGAAASQCRQGRGRQACAHNLQAGQAAAQRRELGQAVGRILAAIRNLQPLQLTQLIQLQAEVGRARAWGLQGLLK